MNITQSERERLAEVLFEDVPVYPFRTAEGKDDIFRDMYKIRDLILNAPRVTKKELRALYKTGTWDSYFDWSGLTDLLRSRGVEVVE